MITHQIAFEWMLKDQDGSLDEGSRQELARHLASCPECRQDAALVYSLRSAFDQASSPVPSRPAADREIAAAVLRRRERRRVAVVTLQGLAWAAVLILLLVFCGVAIDHWQPDIASAAAWTAGESLLGPLAATSQIPTSVQAAPGSSSDPSPTSLFPLLILFGGLIFPLLVALVGVWMGRRQAVNGWLAFLLAALGTGLGLMVLSITPLQRGNGFFFIMLIPFLVSVIAQLTMHLWQYRRNWSTLTHLTLALYAFGVLVYMFGPWWGPAGEQVFSPLNLLIFFVIGIVPALVWLAWDWKKPLRWLNYLVLGILLASLLLSLGVSSPNILALYPWIIALTMLSSLLWAVIAPILAVRLIYSWSARTDRLPRSSVWLGIFASLALFASLFANIHLLALRESVNEDPISGEIMIWFVCIGAMMAAVTMAWNLKGRRLWISQGLLMLFVAALFLAPIIPDGLAQKTTLQRVEILNQAVLRFHAQNQRYPVSLAELEPRTLWQVPAPITAFKSVWCYDGAESYYRLGYYDAFQFTSPDRINIRVYASAGEIPAGPSPCESVLQKAREWMR